MRLYLLYIFHKIFVSPNGGGTEAYMSSYTLKTSSFPSSDGKNTVACYFYEPIDADIKGIVQLSHGMCEYVQRYAHVADFFCKNGYVFCGNDHIGHGNTAANSEELGYIGRGGVDHIVDDLHKTTRLALERYPNKPLVLFGHSMGSFMARIYLTKYGDELAGAIICGTGGPESPASLGKLMTSIAMIFRNDHYRSKFINNVSFAGYNKYFKDDGSESAWVTSDREVVKKYDADPLCNFKFTLRGHYNLFEALERVSSKKWAHLVPKELPLFVVSGKLDPVGNYGRGVETVYKRLKDAGVRSVKLKLYDNARHEPHNEIESIRCEFLSDILGFVAEICDKNA